MRFVVYMSKHHNNTDLKLHYHTSDNEFYNSFDRCNTFELFSSRFFEFQVKLFSPKVDVGINIKQDNIDADYDIQQ
jgi:hypothetical protein